MKFSNGNPKRVPKPSRDGARRAKLADLPRAASKRPPLAAGLLLLLLISTHPDCRCHGNRTAEGRDGGTAVAATATLAGTVADRRDRPVPEARVLAFPLAGEDNAPLETATNLAKRFRFARLPPEPYRLLVETA